VGKVLDPTSEELARLNARGTVRVGRRKLQREHYRSAIQDAPPNVWRKYVLDPETDRHRIAARNWLRRVAKEDGKRIEFSRKKLDPNSLYFVLR